MDFTHVENARLESNAEAQITEQNGARHVSKRIKQFGKKIKNDINDMFILQGKDLNTEFNDEDEYKWVEENILDPRGSIINQWNKVFLSACLLSLFVDPLFFYVPYHVKEGNCMDESDSLKVALTIVRSLVDTFYMVHIYVRFRTAYVAPSSRIFGTGELVVDPNKISSRYLNKDFWLDLAAALPLPQVLIWIAIPNMRAAFVNVKDVIRLIIIFQFLMRLCLTFPLTSQITKASGILLEKAWAGAAFNLMLYMLASHVTGSCWYLLSIERQEACWTEICAMESPYCEYPFLNCYSPNEYRRAAWFNSSNLSIICNPHGNFYQFGMYADALASSVTSAKFLKKFFYCFWWGMRQLSSLGQGLEVSTYVGEISFAIIIGILGLVLFSLLVSNMQTYIQSVTMRREEWRIRREDAEGWMKHRQLTRELKQSVRRYFDCQWVASGGFNEETLLDSLPKDLRRQIKHHLYFDLVRRVPLFDEMDDDMLDAVCQRLRNVLFIPGSFLLQEGVPLAEMLFIIRGHLDSFTTNGGRSGFLNTCSIGPGEFCGEELLTWAMVPRPRLVLPSSTRTVRAVSEVEALALTAEDLKCVATQFRRLHWKQLRPTFRFTSQMWRTWAACFIQAAWFSYKKRKMGAAIRVRVKEDGSGSSLLGQS